MSKPKMPILTFFESPFILNIKTLSPTQKIILKVINNELLDSKKPIPNKHPYQEIDKPGGFDSEVELFKWLTGKDEYDPTDKYTDASLASGRRSGKSSVISAGYALYMATQHDYSGYLGTSPFATIPIISPTKEQANEVYAAIKNMLLKSPYLVSEFLGGDLTQFQGSMSEDNLGENAHITGRQIQLTNKVVIKVLTADVNNIRGFACPFYTMDEACWMGMESNDLKNSDIGVYQAIQPATAQFGDIAFGLKISSPNGEAGLMYQDYQSRNKKGILHFQAATWWMNPSIGISYLEKQKLKGELYFNREYGAMYTSSENAYLNPDSIERAVVRGMEALEYRPGFRYVAAIDYATKVDYWTLAIGHKEYIYDPLAKERLEYVYVDYLYHWKGDPGNELDPAAIIPEICIQLKKYQVSYCLSDQYAFAALKGIFEREGVNLKEFKASTQSKLKYMYSLQVAINSNSLRMVSKTLAIRHLKDLREKRSHTGQIKIEAIAGGHDDYASSIGLIVYQFDKSSPLYIGTHKADDGEGVSTSKDAAGRFISTPTATDLAQHVGLSDFNDNKDSLDKDKGGGNEGEDGGGMWFVF